MTDIRQIHTALNNYVQKFDLAINNFVRAINAILKLKYLKFGFLIGPSTFQSTVSVIMKII